MKFPSTKEALAMVDAYYATNPEALRIQALLVASITLEASSGGRNVVLEFTDKEAPFVRHILGKNGYCYGSLESDGMVKFRISW